MRIGKGRSSSTTRLTVELRLNRIAAKRSPTGRPHLIRRMPPMPPQRRLRRGQALRPGRQGEEVDTASKRGMFLRVTLLSRPDRGLRSRRRMATSGPGRGSGHPVDNERRSGIRPEALRSEGWPGPFLAEGPGSVDWPSPRETLASTNLAAVTMYGRASKVDRREPGDLAASLYVDHGQTPIEAGQT